MGVLAQRAGFVFVGGAEETEGGSADSGGQVHEAGIIA